MRTIAKIVALGAAALVAVGLAGCSDTSAPGGGDASGSTLNLARVGIAQDAAVKIARDQGYYEQHGVTIADQVVANPPAAIAAVQSGQIDIAYTPTTSYFTALSQGVDLQIIAPSDGYPADALTAGDPFDRDNTGVFVRPDSGIATAADLAGKTVAIPARNAQLEVTIAANVKEAGADPASVNWVVLDFASAVEALKGGTVDAAGVVTPFTTQAKEAGMVQLMAPAVEFFGGPSTTGLWVSTPSIIEQKGEAIDAFIAAQREANEYANANLTEAMTIAKDMLGLDLPVEEITPVYWVPELDPADVRSQAERIHDLGYLAQPVDLENAFYTPSA